MYYSLPVSLKLQKSASGILIETVDDCYILIQMDDKENSGDLQVESVIEKGKVL